MSHQLTRLDLLILARLATAGSRRPSAARLRDDLWRFVQSRFSQGEWSRDCRARLGALQGAGLVDERRVVTQLGLDRLCAELGVDELPPRWSKLWRSLIPALALDLPASRWSDVGSADKLRARVIRQAYDLKLPDCPTLLRAVDAQAWQALGLEDRGPLTLGKLRRALVERTLKTSLRAKSVDAATAGQWLATAAADTTTRDIDAVVRALVDRWVFESVEPESAEPESAPPEPAPPEPAPRTSPAPAVAKPARSRKTTSPPPSSPRADDSLQQWASRVLALAQRTQRGRYGDARVFIAAVWQSAGRRRNALGRSLSDFKLRLVEANRAGLLTLHRADLVGAMDRELVRQSETQVLTATFHFIEISAEATP